MSAVTDGDSRAPCSNLLHFVGELQMPVSSNPIRLDADIVAAARQVAPMMARSVAQQIAHWARIGRELEAHPGVSVEKIRDVLSGAKSYDQLSVEEQSVTRAYWAARMERLRGRLRLDEQLEASAVAYAELDEAGNVVVREHPKL